MTRSLLRGRICLEDLAGEIVIQSWLDENLQEFPQERSQIKVNFEIYLCVKRFFSLNKIIFKGHVSPPADELGNSDPIKVTIKGERKIFFPPSEGYRRILARPKNELVLDWVYGCRGSDVNKNLWILKTGELVYFVSTFVVIYNRYKETQRHYR